MDFRPIDPGADFDVGMNIGWYSELREYNRALDMYCLYPDLFVGAYNNDGLVGICYGWPSLYVHRSENITMGLQIISMIPGLRGMGHGSRLMAEWERRVGLRGKWMVELGSGADMFYVKNGYKAVEYCIRTHKCNLVGRNPSAERNFSFVMREHDPVYNLYFRTNGVYDQGEYEDLKKSYSAVSACTIFHKEIGKTGN